MIDKQIRAKYGSGIPLAFHSNPAKVAMTREVRTRLVMYAIGDAVEGNESDSKTRQGGQQPYHSSFLKYLFAHAVKDRDTDA